jgi:indole-3-glycerol phosphate synthase
MDILEKIVNHKRQEVAECKELYPIKLLERSIYYQAQPLSLKSYIMRDDLSGIIAEFKRKSPSKGMINEYAKPEKVCLEYMQGGASALSVLTDNHFFGGSSKDLTTARRSNFCPILRKDFIVEEYQIIEARSIGADAILLIAEILTKDELKLLSNFAASLNLEVLFEVHDEESIAKLPSSAQIIGINSRNLKDFSVDINHSIALLKHLPEDSVKIAESGIDTPERLITLKENGFNGFLIGERFMKEANPGKACAQFIGGIKELKRQAVK